MNSPKEGDQAYRDVVREETEAAGRINSGNKGWTVGVRQRMMCGFKYKGRQVCNIGLMSGVRVTRATGCPDCIRACDNI